MSGYTLTWRGGKGGVLPTDGCVLRPDTLGAMPTDELARVPWIVGRQTTMLGDWFAMTGEPGPRLVVRDIPLLDGLGSQMQSGELVIDGDAGDELGASMSGGVIHVTGNVGDRAGGPATGKNFGMTGGEIVIRGNAGQYAGFLMRRGLILIAGTSQNGVGYRFLAGTIVVGRGPLDHPGLSMRRGTIVCLDPQAKIVTGGTFREEGVFEPVALRVVGRRVDELWDAFSIGGDVGGTTGGATGGATGGTSGGGPAEALSTEHPRALTPCGEHSRAWVGGWDGRWRLWSGDHLELGRGDLWQRVE
ncbi:MAG: hypothetical protein IT440_04250 [Phycisphaeraceae bacterium]|nr:hypothetical protein [Phycisphaeraceae bacterium]